MLFRSTGRVDDIIQLQSSFFHSLIPYLAAADALAGSATAVQLVLDVLAQAGALVAFHHIRRGDIADHPVHPAVARDGRFDIGDQARSAPPWCRGYIRRAAST